MMDLPNLTILDVGHGNCAVLTDDKAVIVFDGGPGDTLMRFLEANGVTHVSAVLVSHAHDDHIAGLLTLLLDEEIIVERVYLNPDPTRTRIWGLLRSAFKCARQEQGTTVNTQLNTSISGQIEKGSIHVEILAPTPEIAMSGVGGSDLEGKPLSAHSMNAVIRLTRDGIPLVLLSGDINSHGARDVLRMGGDLHAAVLVFPHHGGRVESGDTPGFARELLEKVRPDVVVFSIGRGRHGTPQPDVVRTVREVLPRARILCTQLSEHCAGELVCRQFDHLNAIPAAGIDSYSCCAGSISIDLLNPSLAILPGRDEHRRFIREVASTALCLR